VAAEWATAVVPVVPDGLAASSSLVSAANGSAAGVAAGWSTTNCQGGTAWTLLGGAVIQGDTATVGGTVVQGDTACCAVTLSGNGTIVAFVGVGLSTALWDITLWAAVSSAIVEGGPTVIAEGWIFSLAGIMESVAGGEP